MDRGCLTTRAKNRGIIYSGVFLGPSLRIEGAERLPVSTRGTTSYKNNSLFIAHSVSSSIDSSMSLLLQSAWLQSIYFPVKTRPRYDLLLCVNWDVKPYTLSHSLTTQALRLKARFELLRDNGC